MKKLISILAVVLFAVSAMAQVTSQSGKLETIKSFRLGTCKLVRRGNVSDNRPNRKCSVS